eukprot:scaffold70385_cov23-Prasinocladus_malaysianus.AAC.2
MTFSHRRHLSLLSHSRCQSCHSFDADISNARSCSGMQLCEYEATVLVPSWYGRAEVCTMYRRDSVASGDVIINSTTSEAI